MNRIVELVERLEAERNEDARALVTEVLAFHRDGLEKLVAAMSRSELADACRDPQVESLLALHDLSIPSPPALVPATALLKHVRRTSDDPCELCGESAGHEHAHLFDREKRELACVCVACRLALEANPASRWRTVPARLERLPSKSPTAVGELGAPVGLAFVVLRKGRATLHYPGPAGLTQAAVEPATWQSFVAGRPLLEAMTDDVEAFLFDVSRGSDEQWLVGIDRCYELVERLRRHWQGLTGGEEARSEVRRFFGELAREAAS